MNEGMKSNEIGGDRNRFAKTVADTAESAIDKAENAVDSAQKEAKKYQREIEEYIQDNPVKSIGIALLVGVFSAALLRSMSK